MTKTNATRIARQFVADYVKPHRQWNTETMESYLPAGRFRDGASYIGPATTADIAAFIHRETIDDDKEPPDEPFDTP